MRVDKKYEIIIYWSSEDNAYLGEVPELLSSRQHSPKTSIH